MHLLTTRSFRVGLAAALLIGALGLIPSSTASASAPGGLDHMKCYSAATQMSAAAPAYPLNPWIVTLTDEFGTWPVIVAKKANRVCNPVEKTINLVGAPPIVTPITNPDAHLVCFGITRPPTLAAPVFNVVVTNQFGVAAMTTSKATELCLPSWKSLAPLGAEPSPAPPGLDHFECYAASYTKNAAGAAVQPFPPFPKPVGLNDEFGPVSATVMAPNEICNPVQKVLPTGQSFAPQNPAAHLVCYPIRQTPLQPATTVFTQNQFGAGVLSTSTTNKLCLPSFKDIVG